MPPIITVKPCTEVVIIPATILKYLFSVNVKDLDKTIMIIGICSITAKTNKNSSVIFIPPTSPQNTKNYFLVDPVFWADNGTELGEKWEAMKAGL